MSRNVLFKGTPVTLLGNEIKVGDKAPDFTALKTDMSSVKFVHYKLQNSTKKLQNLTKMIFNY